MRPLTSASNLRRRELCPGSAREEKGLPDDNSPLAREGTLLHDYGAHPEYDRRMLKPYQKDLVDLSDSLAQSIIQQVERDEKIPDIPDYEDYVEKQMQLVNVDFGKPDLVRFYKQNIGIVIDRKFGFNVVERADLNAQLRAYAVLAFDFHQALTGTSNTLSRIYVGIVQPRAPFDERITVASYEPADIIAAKAQIMATLKESSRPQARLIAGDEQCQHCKAAKALSCPAFNQAMTIPPALTPDSALSKTAREAFLEQRLAACSDAQLEKILLAVKLAKIIYDIAHDEARKRVNNGELTNYTVGKESEVREVVNVRKAMSLLALSGMVQSDVYECVTEFSISKLAEILRKRHPNWTWKQANEWINNKLKAVIEKSNRKGRLLRK